MEILQLKYFQVVARLEHMTKAAEVLHISQPALSKTIRLLEEQVGVSLFDRQGKTIRLNEQGMLFLKRVDKALALLEDGVKECQTDEQLGEIKLAVLSGSGMIPSLLRDFQKQYPKIKFKLVQQALESDADVCLSSTRMSHMENCPLLREDILVAVPLTHELATCEVIDLIEVEKESFIALSKGKPLRELTDLFCQVAGFVPQVVCESDNPAMVQGLIKANLGIAFVPKYSWGHLENIALLKVREPICERRLFLSWPTNRYETLAVKLFKDFAVNYFRMYG